MYNFGHRTLIDKAFVMKYRLRTKWRCIRLFIRLECHSACTYSFKNAIVFTPDTSNRFLHLRFLQATLSSSSTI